MRRCVPIGPTEGRFWSAFGPLVRRLKGFRIFDTLVQDQEVLSPTFLSKGDNCDKKTLVAAKADSIDSSAMKGINKLRILNRAQRMPLIGSTAARSLLAEGRLLQLCEFGFRSVFPNGEEVLVGGLGFGCVALHRKGAGQLQKHRVADKLETFLQGKAVL